MRRRVKGGTRKASPTFNYFRVFLAVLGPKPKGYTLERPDNSNYEYSPNNAIWASIKTQNNNKGDTLKFTDPKTGKVFTTFDLDKKHGKKPGTTRKRHHQGWSAASLIAGYKLKDDEPVKPQPSEPSAGLRLEAAWLEAMSERYPNRVVLTSPERRGRLVAIDKRLSGTGIPTDRLLRAAIVSWSKFTSRVDDEEGIEHIPPYPDVGFISRYLETLATMWQEAVARRDAAEAKAERARIEAEKERAYEEYMERMYCEN